MRLLRFIPFLLLSSALADRITINATGLPAGLSGTALVGNASVPLGGTATVPAGTYTITPRAVADGGRVYVAAPVKVTVKGQVTAKVNYTKLNPGAFDPFFGKNGVLNVSVPGFETWDSWVVYSGDNAILTSTGSFQNVLAQVVTLNGSPLGPITKVTSANRPLGNGRISTGLLPDGTGFLAGLSYTSGTLVRLDAKGQLDTTWTTTPAQGIIVRGLLRLADGGVLAYGGENPSVWKLKADGASDTAFGQGGILDLPVGDTFQKGVRAARLLSSGVVRLVVIHERQLQLVDIDKDLKVTVVAPPTTLPISGTPPYGVRNVVQADDGTTMVVTADPIATTAQIVRIGNEGKIDSTFASPVLKNVALVSGLTQQQDGKVIVAIKDTDGKTIVTRFNQDGKPDVSFGKSGSVTLDGQTYGVEIGTDGKLNVVSIGLATPLVSKSAYIGITRLLTE